VITTVGGVRMVIEGDDSDFKGTMRQVKRDAERTGQTITREFKKADGEVKKLNNQLRGTASALSGLAGIVSGGILAGAIIQAADAFSGMRSKIALSISAADDLLEVERQLYQQAVANRAALEPVVSLYQRIRGARSDLSNEQTLEITDRFSKSLVISGASAQGAASATLQFSQAIAGGVLRAEEFNSIIESNVRFVKLLADNLGVSVGEIRNLVNEGVITSDVIFKAIKENGADLDAEFTKIPLTVGSALVNVRNAFTNFVGLSDQAGGTSAKLAGFINSIADDFDRLAEVVVVAVATIGGAVAGLASARIIGALVTLTSTAGTATTAMAALRGALAFFGGPIGLAVTAVAGAFAYLAVTSKDAADRIDDVNGSIRRYNQAQADIAADTELLTSAQERLRDAIESQGDAAVATATLEVDSIRRRISKNQELAKTYESLAKAQLAQARAATAQSERELSRNLNVSFTGGLGAPASGDALQRQIDRFVEMTTRVQAAGGQLSEWDRGVLEQISTLRNYELQVAAAKESIAALGIALGIPAAAIKAAPAAIRELTDEEIKAAEEAAKALEEAQLDLLDVLDDADEFFQGRRDAATQQRYDEFKLNQAQQDAEARAGAQQRYDLFLLNKAAEDKLRAQISGALAQGLEEGIRSGNWGEAFRGILAQSTSDALSKAVNELASELVNILGKALGSGGFSGVASFFGFDGNRAAGGPVKAGMRYMVGEQGPEMFVPTVPGMILPKSEFPASAALGGVGGGGVYVDNKFIVQGSVTEEVLPRVQAMMAAQARELPRIIDSRVKDSSRRGRY